MLIMLGKLHAVFQKSFEYTLFKFSVFYVVLGQVEQNQFGQRLFK